MKTDKWKTKFNWVQIGSVWIQQDKNEEFNDNRFISISDIYFKEQKYLSGVTFSYVNKLGDIYKRDLLTGDGYSLLNMYNEYDIIDRVLKNIKIVDVASTVNVDITKQWTKINNVQLKPDQLVLLFNQTSEFENDVYKVTQQSYLENAGFLSSRDKSERFSASVKMGNYKDKQLYLINNGLDFPTTGEPKHFIEGNSFILKHIIKYNLFNSSSNSALTSKIIFTDYEIAKKQLPINSSLYSDVTSIVSGSTTPSEYFKISHHHDEFSIRSGVTSDREYTGSASQITNITNPIHGGTTITGISPFVSGVDDYVRLDIMSGSTTYLTMNAHIKFSDSTTIVLEELIPNRILNFTSGFTFNLFNYNIATSWSDAISQLNSNSPYSNFFDITDSFSGDIHNLLISAIDYKYDLYFDYSDLNIEVSDGVVDDISFNSSNNYISYNLYDRLNAINDTVFNDNDYTFFNTQSFTSSSFNSVYTDDSRIKLTFTGSSDASYFREYTYVYLNNDESKKVMIWKIDGADVYLDKPPSFSSSFPIVGSSPTTITQITNIDGLRKISDILQEVYINVDNDWYISKKDNIRRSICSAYGQLLSDDAVFTRNVTGLLYENSNNEFVLKLYDLETDSQLTFTTVELMYLGADRKTRLPVPILKENLTLRSTFMSDWNILDDGLVYLDSAGEYISTNTTDEFFDFGSDEVLGGPNDPPLMFTIIDGNGYPINPL